MVTVLYITYVYTEEDSKSGIDWDSDQAEAAALLLVRSCTQTSELSRAWYTMHNLSHRQSVCST